MVIILVFSPLYLGHSGTVPSVPSPVNDKLLASLSLGPSALPPSRVHYFSRNPAQTSYSHPFLQWLPGFFFAVSLYVHSSLGCLCNQFSSSPWCALLLLNMVGHFLDPALCKELLLPYFILHRKDDMS